MDANEVARVARVHVGELVCDECETAGPNGCEPKADGIECTDDGFACSSDECRSGRCFHDLLEDRPECLIVIQFSSFIPYNHILGPSTATCNDGFNTQTLIFNGDDRGPSLTSPSFKTRQIVGPQSLFQDVGESRAYEPLTFLADGKISPDDDDTELNDCAFLHQRATATTEGMSIQVIDDGNSRLIRLTGDASNPLVPLAPAISWNVTAQLDPTSSNEVAFEISGDHDGFPGYDLFLGQQEVYSYDPGPAECLTVANTQVPCPSVISQLFPPLDVTIPPLSGTITTGP